MMDTFEILVLQNVGKLRRTKYLPLLEARRSFDEIVFELDIKSCELENAKNLAENIICKSEKSGINIVNFSQEEYPENFKKIKDFPLIIYIKGRLENSKNIAVVGTRKPSRSSIKITEEIVHILADANFSIVSGLAEGVDTIAHRTCVRENSKTVAILPCGLDKVYPFKNKSLADDILSIGGCLISEYSPIAELEKYCFIQRDRLQAALSEAVVVVETSVKGGTMHTAKFAQKYEKKLITVVHEDELMQSYKFSGNLQLVKNSQAIPLNDTDKLYLLINNGI